MLLLAGLLLSCAPKKTAETGTVPGNGGPDGGSGGDTAADGGSGDSGAGDSGERDSGGGDGGAERLTGERSLDKSLAIGGVDGSGLGTAIAAGALLSGSGRQLVLGAPNLGRVEVIGEADGAWSVASSLLGDFDAQPGGALAVLDADAGGALAVGAIHDSRAGADAGAVHLLWAPLPEGEASLEGATDLILTGQAEQDFAGGAVAFGTMLGGETLALAVGAGQADAGATNSGGVYVVGSLDAGGTRALGDADARLGWSRGAALLGTAIAAGDIDGDGISDLALGGFGDDSLRGAAAVVHGPLAGDLDLAVDGDAVVYGAEVYDLAGYAVALLDTDGDGHDELAVGIPGDDSVDAERGSVLLFAAPSGTLDAASATAQLDGLAAYDRAGWSLDGAGDVDGDGRDELLVGAPADDAGGAWLVYGPLSGRRVLDPGLDARWSASGTAISAGDVVAGVGDLVGDGTPDLAIAAPDAATAWLVDAAVR